MPTITQNDDAVPMPLDTEQRMRKQSLENYRSMPMQWVKSNYVNDSLIQQSQYKRMQMPYYNQQKSFDTYNQDSRWLNTIVPFDLSNGQTMNQRITWLIGIGLIGAVFFLDN